MKLLIQNPGLRAVLKTIRHPIQKLILH